MAKSCLALLLGLPLALLLGACEEKIATAPPGAGQQPTADADAGDGGDAGPATKPVDINESEFAETDKSRDPFRSFASTFVDESAGKGLASQRKVVLDEWNVDELKLAGIVTRIHPAKAMLVDPEGVGHVVQRGQLLGRAEVVQPAGPGGAAYEVHWRVDRIRDREGDIVLVREDRGNPEVPVATKVIPLRPEGTLVVSD